MGVVATARPTDKADPILPSGEMARHRALAVASNALAPNGHVAMGRQSAQATTLADSHCDAATGRRRILHEPTHPHRGAPHDPHRGRWTRGLKSTLSSRSTAADAHLRPPRGRADAAGAGRVLSGRRRRRQDGCASPGILRLRPPRRPAQSPTSARSSTTIAAGARRSRSPPPRVRLLPRGHHLNFSRSVRGSTFPSTRSRPGETSYRKLGVLSQQAVQPQEIGPSRVGWPDARRSVDDA